MAIVLGLALLVLGLAVGFIIAWAFNIGATLGLFIGLVLVVAGAIVGFISEWLIDEAYRKNRELRRRLDQHGDTMPALGIDVGARSGDLASGTLADFLRQRDSEVRELREQLTETHSRLDGLRDEFETYQRGHPDALTVIKGIGPVYQWKLRDVGVNTYQQLAAADPDQLRRMLDIKEWQRVDIGSWIEQARDWAQREG
jgi:predicted flap endonuclease-1-like 5' DNA nuclease